MSNNDKVTRLLADDDSWKCREALRREIERVVGEALNDGWEQEDIALSLVEIADEHLDQFVGGAMARPSSGTLH